MDEQEAVWLASVHLRDRLGPDTDQWDSVPDVEARLMGWVVSFRNTGHFKPGDGPLPLALYVFRDGWVERVSKHGPNFHEFRRWRSAEQMHAEQGDAADAGGMKVSRGSLASQPPSRLS